MVHFLEKLQPKGNDNMRYACRLKSLGLILVLNMCLTNCSVEPLEDDEALAVKNQGGAKADESTTDNNTTFKVLFDQAHAECAGKACWIIDDQAPNPEPASPTSAGDWTGYYSAFGFELFQSGKYVVNSQPQDQLLTYGNEDSSTDLSHYDVLVVPEPNTHFARSERNAIINFVKAGGGLFMIADHNGSDRNGDGVDSIGAWNTLFTDNDVETYPFLFQFNKKSINQRPTYQLNFQSDIPIFDIQDRLVNSFGIYQGTSITINPTDPESTETRSVYPLAWENGFANNNARVVLCGGQYGAGRFVAIGDSSLASDGQKKGSSSSTNKDAWNGFDNRNLLLNIIAWLAGEVN